MNKEYRMLKAYRAINSVNQKTMAEVCGTTIAQYSRKERGLIPFTLIEAKKIAEYFDTNIEDIFFKDKLTS